MPLDQCKNNPVGEGQDEPNNSPVLLVPTEGRKIKDFIESKKLNILGYLNLNFLLGHIKFILIGFLVFVLFIILFIYPGILIKKN